MELKEQAGDKDLYDVMKKERRKHKGQEGKLTAQYDKTVRRERSTFDFINKKLCGNKKGQGSYLKLGLTINCDECNRVDQSF